VELLYKRYVEFKRLEVIAVELNYTYSYIRAEHGHALQSFDKLLMNKQSSYTITHSDVV
jgi:hypothetical protein